MRLGCAFDIATAAAVMKKVFILKKGQWNKFLMIILAVLIIIAAITVLKVARILR